MAQEAASADIPASEAGASKRTRKDRVLSQIKSLDEEDDERTSISKRISWILRHGAKLAGVEQEAKTKWVKFNDLCESEILKDFSHDVIWKVIIDFNGKKLRYELEGDAPGPSTRIRAHQRGADYKRDSTTAHDVPYKVDGVDGMRRDATEFVPATSPAAGQAATAPTAAHSAPAATATGGATAPSAHAILQAQQQAAHAAALQQMQQQFAAYSANLGGCSPMLPFMNPYAAWQAQAQQVQQAQQAQQAPKVGQLTGRIKSFNATKGFGFIECQQTHEQYGRDVFLHKAQIGDLETGSAVQFFCELNKQGMPQAKDVQPLAAGATPPPPPPQFETGGKDGGKAGKGGKGGKFGKDGGKDGKGRGSKGKGEGKKGKGEGGGKGGSKERKESSQSADKAEGGKEAVVEAAADAAAS